MSKKASIFFVSLVQAELRIYDHQEKECPRSHFLKEDCILNVENVSRTDIVIYLQSLPKEFLF